MKKGKFWIMGLIGVSCFALGCACAENENVGSSGGSANNPLSTAITLNGFDVNEEVNYYYGSYVDVQVPLVIDSIGNVVDVYYTVKDKSGEIVALEYGKFFGMEEDGYTIEYTVNTADGKTHTKTQNVNIIKKYIVEEAVLADVEGETRYDLINALPEEHRETVAGLQAIPTTRLELIPYDETEGVRLTSTELDLTKTPQGYYKFTAKAPMGNEMEYAEVYSCYVDFYSASDMMVWVDNDALNIKNAHAKIAGMTEAIATENLPDGAAAKQYFYITDDENDGAGNFLMSISAAHSKEYYQMWQEKGASGLLYDVYLTDAIGTCGYFVFDKKMQPQWLYAGWNTIEIPMDTLLDYYADYGDDGAASFNFGNMMQSGEYSYKVQMYVGNFRGKYVDKTLDPILNLANTANSFDFISMLEANGKAEAVALLQENGKDGEIVWEVDGETDFEISDLRGIHGIKAKSGGIVIYNATADFYDETEGFVWLDNTNLSLDNVYLKYADMTKAIVTENLPVGAAASEYYLITDTNYFMFSVSGLHSKAYYEMWKNKGISAITYDAYSVSTVSSGNYFYNHGSANVVYLPGGDGTLRWVTVEIPLDTVIANFDYYSDMSNYTANNNMLQAGNNGANYQLYIGNFQAKIAGAITDATINLADISGAFDFVEMLTKNGKTDAAAFLNAHQALGALTMEIDGLIVTDVSALEGIYTVTVRRGGIALYTGEVDFYDANDGCVWVNNAAFDLENVRLKGAGMTKSVIEKDALSDEIKANASDGQYFVLNDDKETEDSYFVFSVIGMHSKAYYEMWKDKGATALKYDVYSISSSTTGNYFYNNGTGEWIPGTTELKWYTVEIAMETLLENFESYATDSYFAKEKNMLFAENHAYTYTMYVGNFRVE